MTKSTAINKNAFLLKTGQEKSDVKKKKKKFNTRSLKPKQHINVQ